ncbi:MAG: heavy-metal-associated domain-containing protein [Fluviicola sp.]
MFKTILFIAFLFGTQLVSAQKEPSKQTVTIKTPNTCDHCKVCETCGGKLEAELGLAKGIQSVTYNEADQTTTVVYWTKKTTVEQIRKEISLLGFDADEVKADPNGYRERDGCCKGG